jgi:DNA-directed RNA polymerase subunit RPC12/RpoP
METTVLRCEGCGRLTDKLEAARYDVRSLSLGKEIRRGDLLCARCVRELQEERTDEEIVRGPA